MKRLCSSRAIFAIALCFVSLSAVGCGSGHSSGHTATIAVLRGDKSAMANPVGADGLTPVGAGFVVTQMYFSDNIAAHTRSQFSTDANGRVVVDLGSTFYYYFAADQCSTIVSVEYNSNAHMTDTNYYSTPDFNDLNPSNAMRIKASLVANALGVDAVVLVGSDADVCTAE